MVGCRCCGRILYDDEYLYKGVANGRAYYAFCSEECAEEYMEIEEEGGEYFIDEMNYEDVEEWKMELEEDWAETNL